MPDATVTHNLLALVFPDSFSVVNFYERTLFEADDQCQKHQLGLNYRSG